MKNIALKYFQAFSNKDINSLQNIFDEGIVLRDWDIYAEGIHAVLDANSKIFSTVEAIMVTPKNMYQDGNVVIAEVDIEINASELIKVIDIIEFTYGGKIRAIRAFKG